MLIFTCDGYYYLFISWYMICTVASGSCLLALLIKIYIHKIVMILFNNIKRKFFDNYNYTKLFKFLCKLLIMSGVHISW